MELQQEQQLLQFNQIDMKKIMSLLDDDNNNGDNTFSSSSSGESGALYVPHQITHSTTTSGCEPNSNGYYPVVPVTIPEANVNEDNAIWDGLWNLDFEGQGSFGGAACAPRKHYFQNMVIPFC